MKGTEFGEDGVRSIVLDNKPEPEYRAKANSVQVLVGAHGAVGAEAILQLRAVYLSCDFDSYWSFHIEKDQQRIHPPGQWSVVLK